MAIYVRELSKKEGNQLKHDVRKGSDPLKVRRSLVVLASAQRKPRKLQNYITCLPNKRNW
jgi:hypothetical protein